MPSWDADRWGGLPVMFTVMAVVFVAFVVFIAWVVVRGNKDDVRLLGELPGTASQAKEEARLARIKAREERKAAEQASIGEDGVHHAQAGTISEIKD